MGVAAAHSASALANSARPIREPTSLSLGLSLRNALEMIQPLNCTVGLPPVPKSFSSKGGSKVNGRAQPRLMHLGDLRCSKEQPPGVESRSSNRLSEGPGSEFGSPWESSGPVANMFPSLSETTFKSKSDKNFVINKQSTLTFACQCSHYAKSANMMFFRLQVIGHKKGMLRDSKALMSC